MQTFLSTELLDNTVQTWLIALGVALGTMLLIGLISVVMVKRLQSRTKASSTIWDDHLLTVLGATRWWFTGMMGLWAGQRVLTLPEGARRGFQIVATLVLLAQIALWINTLISALGDHYRRTHFDQQPGSVSKVGVLSFIARVAAWSVILLMALDNVGVDVTALVAGLGVGGIAVALAVQNVLGDLFASLSIVIDKPFEIGDFLVIGDTVGTVERIGIKTTRLRSLQGEQIVVANSDLLGSRIHNYKRMEERRVVLAIGVTYQTTADQLRMVPGILERAVEAVEGVRFDRAHFKSFGDYDLKFECVYWVESSDYAVFMDAQQTINLTIFEAFEDAEIEFAFPTQQLFVSADRVAKALEDRTEPQKGEGRAEGPVHH